jgi:hypothetical protein
MVYVNREAWFVARDLRPVGRVEDRYAVAILLAGKWRIFMGIDIENRYGFR